MSGSGIPILNPRLVLGLKTDVAGTAQFISDDDVVYSVGCVLAFHNVAQRRQKFVKLPEKGKNIISIIISPNKHTVAVAERGERPSVTLYDAGTLKKKRQITIPADRDVLATEFVAVSFTFDSKSLMCVSGEPDWVLYCFKCDKGKLESATRANNSNGTGIVCQVACNPNDANLLALAGNQIIRILACSESVWRQYGYSKADQINITAAAWLAQDRLLVGTDQGKFLLIENGELKAVFWAGDMPVINMKIKEDLQRTSQTSLSMLSGVVLDEEESHDIKCITVFNKGFLFAYRYGTIHLYEKETPHRYRKRNVFYIPRHDLERPATEEEELPIMNDIHSISINISEDRIIATCNQNQIFTVRLWGPDLTMNPEIQMTEQGASLHHGSIGGLAVCAWKPIFMTSGAWDRTLRIWNYEVETLEVTKEYQEDVYGIALHPTGHYAAVGFSDKLRFLTILIDDFANTKEFPIRNCKLCSFSTMGHLFAAVNANIIQVYSSISLTLAFVLKGHSGKISALSWTDDDQKMASCGSDGAVYEWDIKSTTRISETIIKSCNFTGAAITSDGKSIFAVGSDGQLREIMDGNLHRDLNMVPDGGIDNIKLSNSDMMLFATANSGSMYSIKLPLLDCVQYSEFSVHSTTVTHMEISFNDKFLITCSLDGVICIWRLLNTEGKAIKLDKEFKPSSEILISRQDLQDRINMIKDLQLRMHELQTEHAYQMRQNDVVHNLRMKDVHEGYCSAIEELKEKNEQLEADHVQEINNINIEIAKLKSNHEQFVQKLESNYNEKLINEYDKYLRLEEKLARMRLNYEKELEDLTRAKKESEENITNDFLQKLKDKEVQWEELVEQTQQKTKEHELIKQQIEDDADREIYELKTAHEKELKEEQDANVRLRGETGIIKKKLLASQKEIDDLKHSVYSLENEHVKFKGIIVGLEKDIADLKKEIAERDATIQDKERRIFELKSKNQELEKFKFILDFKIKELQSQIEPRERTIREQTEQINDMVRELENLQRIVISLDLQLVELREKLAAADNELKREVEKNRNMKSALKTIRIDIHQASGLIQDIPKLTKVLKEMYHKYNADKDFAVTQAEDVEAKNEFLRQRDFLERTVRTLKQQVNKSASGGGSDKIRLIEENAALITETNILRTDLKVEERQNRKMQSVLGLSSKYMLPRDAQKRLNDAIATREAIHNEYKQKMKDRETRINALKDENQRLLSKIPEEEDESAKDQKEGKRSIQIDEKITVRQNSDSDND